MASESEWPPAAAGRSCRLVGPKAASASALEGKPVAKQRQNTLPRASRLNRSRDFARVFERPFRSHDRCFVVLCVANGLVHPRLGLAVSRRRVSWAHDRNRIKRQVRESFRLEGKHLGGYDIVVLPQAQVARLDNPTLRASLTWHWSKLAIHCSRSSLVPSAATRDS